MKPMTILPSLTLAAALALGVSACGKQADTPPPSPSSPPAPAPTVTIAANPTTVVAGASTTLTWSSTNATACTASGAWTGSRPISGSESQTPASAGTSAYTLTCTGSGGSGNATANVVVTPRPATTRLTLDGRVIDAPIANAAVLVSVGSQNFSGAADADGNYSIPVEIADADINSFVSITATGSGAQSSAHFISLLGSFSALRTAAGSDAVLNSAENFRVNITNLSTAEAALVAEANAGTAPTTDASLSAALMRVDQEQLVDIGTAIKLVVDNGVALPSGAADTLQLASSATLRNDFVEQQRGNNNAAFVAARDATLGDPALTTGATAATVPRTAYTFVAAASTEENLLGISVDRDVNGFVFNTDGSGRFSNLDLYTDTLRWTIDSTGSITVRFAQNPALTYSFTDLDANGQPVTVNCRYEITALDIRPVSSISAAQRMRSTTSCSDPKFDSSTDTLRILAFVIPAQLPPLVAADVAGKTYASRVFVQQGSDYNGVVYFDDFVTFNENGTGRTQLLGLTFAWLADPDGSIRAAFSNGVVTRYRLIRPLFGKTALVLQQFDTADATYVYSFPAYPRDGSLTFEPASVPGVYYQSGVGETDFVADGSGATNAAERRLLKGFAIEFFSNGGVGQFFDSIVRDSNGNPMRSASPERPSRTRVWGIHADGNLVSQRYDQPGCVFDSTDPNCTIFDNREVFPVSSADNRRVFLERRTFPSDPASNFTITRFYDYAPPGDYAQPRTSSAQTSTIRASKASSSDAIATPAVKAPRHPGASHAGPLHTGDDGATP